VGCAATADDEIENWLRTPDADGRLNTPAAMLDGMAVAMYAVMLAAMSRSPSRGKCVGVGTAATSAAQASSVAAVQRMADGAGDASWTPTGRGSEVTWAGVPRL